MSNETISILTSARYGKANVRVFRVVREGKWHHIVEYNVTSLLEGDITTSYTQADNSVVVTTDSIKNITYYLAKKSPHILNAERFAIHLGTFFVSKYAHIHKAFVTVEQLRWTRIQAPGNVEGHAVNHPHAFYRDGDDKRIVNVEVDASAGKDKLVANVKAGISDLLVLKSTGSAFNGFHTDEFTTLVPVSERIFSTSIDLSYAFSGISIASPTDEGKLEFMIPLKAGDKGYEGSVWDEDVPVRAKKATLETFAVDESDSVQATLYKMAQRIIAENDGVQTVSYALPNKHYIPVDMKYIGIDNLTPCVFSTFLLSAFNFTFKLRPCDALLA